MTDAASRAHSPRAALPTQDHPLGAALERLPSACVSDEPLVRGGVPQIRLRSSVIVQPSTTVESAAPAGIP